MTHDKTFITELSNGFAQITALIKERVSVLEKDVETQVGIIQVAYDEIKADRAELKDIANCVADFAHTMFDTNDTAECAYEEASNIIEDMYDLVDDEYINDEERNAEVAAWAESGDEE